MWNRCDGTLQRGEREKAWNIRGGLSLLDRLGKSGGTEMCSLMELLTKTVKEKSGSRKTLKDLVPKYGSSLQSSSIWESKPASSHLGTRTSPVPLRRPQLPLLADQLRGETQFLGKGGGAETGSWTPWSTSN